MELGNSEAIKHAVRFGMGVSCLSRRVIAEQLENGSLVELKVEKQHLERTDIWPSPNISSQVGELVVR